MPTVSWLMPAFHAEKTIKRAIESMLNQSFQDFDIIIILEEGDITTYEVCNAYLKNDKRIKIVINKNERNIAGALNAGLERCHSKYIARMDADDFSHFDRLEKQVVYLENHADVGLVASNMNIYKEGKKPEIKYVNSIPDSEEIRANMLFETCLGHPTVMLRSDAYNWKYPIEKAEDYALFSELISKVKMAIIPEVLVDYYENGLTASYTNFEITRKSSEDISRRAILKELGIDTSNWSNSHFGWRYYDELPDDPYGFLIESKELFETIWEINEEKKLFENKTLEKVLNKQWELSKWIIRPYQNVETLYRDWKDINIEEIQDLRKRLKESIDLPDSIINYDNRRNSYIRTYKETTNNTIWLFCAADYGNIGDHAIAEAERRFFESYFNKKIVEVPCNCYRSVIKTVKKCVKPEDLILITGGGFLGSLWFDAEKQAREVVEFFPNNPICILPQTVFWENEEQWNIEKEITKKVYEAHKGKMILCARDVITKKIMESNYNVDKIILVPDMVLSCNWYDSFAGKNRTNALICLKDDKESVLSLEDKKYIEGIAYKYSNNIKQVSTSIIGYYNPDDRADLISNILNDFSEAKIVITDRLHGMLFSVITNTPCIALDNCNHKIKATYEWVRDVKNVKYVSGLKDIDKAINEVIELKQPDYSYLQYKDKFDSLIQGINWLISG
ncbi:MAG: polysaccharide pyruvyl transferase family protein [Pseudobutyrivibrio sp.]|nr:polysaccharide pyruvyl transferase family protein [Pseudobutyrivibrio sp.]